MAQGRLDLLAFGNLGLQLRIGSVEFLGPVADDLFQVIQLDLGLLQQAPFLRQRIGQLLYFDVVKWLLEDDQAVGVAQLGHHIVPGIIRMGRADDHLQVRIRFPQFGSGLNPVPAGSHAHVHKCQGVRLAGGNRLLQQAQPLLPLIGRVNLEDLTFGDRRRLPEQRGFSGFQRVATGRLKR